MLEVGQIVHGRYLVEGLLQKGGSSTVYKAQDQVLETSVAIKQMLGVYSSVQERDEVTQQFQIEARLMARLRHPNLPRVTDFFINENTCCLVMDFVEGESLEQLLQRDGVQPDSAVLEWSMQLCTVLEFLHRQSPPIIFRDLKPANVMRTPEERLKLVDFGISKVGGGSATRALIRGAGTPGYCPPEQYNFDEMHTDPRSDLYGLGATMYALLVGRPPPEAPFRLMAEPSLSVREVNPQVPIELEALILHLLALHPEDRPTSAETVQVTLSRLVSRGNVVELAPIPNQPSAPVLPPSSNTARKVRVKPYPRP